MKTQIHLVMTVLLLTGSAASVARAQSPAVPHGAHRYQSDAAYPGGGTDTWDTLREVRDTVVNGKKMVLTVHRARRSPDGNYLFNTDVVWDPADLTHLQIIYDGSGHTPSTCKVDIAHDTMRVSVDHAPVSTSEVKGPVAAIATLEHLLASRELHDGDTIRTRLLRCEHEPRFFDFVGVVKSDVLKRTASAAPEPVWVITGSPSYQWTYWIAKSDRLLLRAMMDGDYGSQVDNYSGGDS